jgi:hypothetical protein
MKFADIVTWIRFATAHLSFASTILFLQPQMIEPFNHSHALVEDFLVR